MSRAYIKCLGFARGIYCPHEDQYVKSFDHDFNEGQGRGEFTSNTKEAMVFESIGDAMEFWRKISSVKPLRPDGRPNRPMTAMNMTPELVENERPRRKEK